MRKQTYIKIIIILLLMISSQLMSETIDENGLYIGKIIDANNEVRIKFENNISPRENELVYVRAGGNIAVMKLTSLINSTAKGEWTQGFKGYFEQLEVGMAVYRYDKNIKGKALIITDSLRLRKEPNLKSQVVSTVKKGEIVTVLTKSKDQVKIDNKHGYWFNIEFNGISGWVFGGYITQDYYNMDNSTYSWINHKWTDDGYVTKLCIYNITTKKETNLIVSNESFWFKFSAQNKYVAIDCGTDIIGSIEIYDLANKNKIYSTGYTRHYMNWIGNKISIKSIEGSKEGMNNEIEWNEIIFDDGKIKKGKEKGKAHYNN